MKKIILLWTTGFLLNGFVFGQNSTANQSEISRSDSLRRVLKVLNTRYDSLFNIGEYQLIINEISSCSLNDKPSRWESDFNQHLIASYFMLNDTVASDETLKKELFDYDTKFSILHSCSMMNPDFGSMRFYIAVPSNRSKVIQYISDDFKYKVKDISGFNSANKIMHFLLNDQYIRGLSLSWQMFAAVDEINLKQQFEFYQKAGKIFSTPEVGEAMEAFQFLLLAHDGNTLRRDYYLKLIQNAISEKHCKTEHLLDFILRSEMMKKGQKEFLKTLDDRVCALRIEYNLPNYQFGIY